MKKILTSIEIEIINEKKAILRRLMIQQSAWRQDKIVMICTCRDGWSWVDLLRACSRKGFQDGARWDRQSSGMKHSCSPIGSRKEVRVESGREGWLLGVGGKEGWREVKRAGERSGALYTAQHYTTRRGIMKVQRSVLFCSALSYTHR